ncbi:Guanine deaminase [Fukomys damarensis]|uniref:Guanine deaminase n=1 Tax=Fukomys damarensis TaxID=885580 RepID=A0A091E3I6_FUKDA|nr:Guanine deaminase [Fukomys damarensis]
MLEKRYSRVKSTVTPSFSLSGLETLMGELGSIARAHGLYLQSCETQGEAEAVKNLFPSYKNYTDVYDKNNIFLEISVYENKIWPPKNDNLLRDKTTMAHGCYLSAGLGIVHEQEASISHCPNSNLLLSSGFLNVLEVLKRKVKVGPGTDVAGVYSYSTLDAIGRAEIVSNVLLINKVNEESPSLKEVFRLATPGGSQALRLARGTGNSEVGKELDALLIDPKASEAPINLFCEHFTASDASDAAIKKYFYHGGDRNIEKVYVGRKQLVPFSSLVEEPWASTTFSWDDLTLYLPCAQAGLKSQNSTSFLG